MRKFLPIPPFSYTFTISKRIIIILVVISISPSVLLANEQVNAQSQHKGIPVEVVPVEKQTIRSIVHGQGTARAVRREFLSFEAEGKITFIKKGTDGRDLAAGDPVKGPGENEKNGELLASVDSRDSIAQLDIASAAVEQAQQQKIAAETDLDKSKAERQVAVAELKRMRDLVSTNVISQSDFEKSEAAAKQAEATVRAAEAGVKTATSAVASAKAQEIQPQLSLEDTSIFTPINGIISYINIKEGQYFSKQGINSSSEASALQTTPIVIIDPSEFEIVLDLPTFQGTAVKPKQDVYIFTGEMQGQAEIDGIDNLEARKNAIKGGVFSVSPSINPGGRSIQVKVRTRPKNQIIFDGMFVSCWLVVKEHQDAIVLPYNVLSYEGKKAFVFVLNETTAVVERRAVTRGIRGLNGVEILKGLQAGEQVVGKGHNRLTHGSTVKVVAVRNTDSK